MAFDPRHNSRTISDGRDRAAVRAYFYSIGLTMPCNFNLRYPRSRNARCIDAGRTLPLRSHSESSMIAA
jgi:hypothetical protein